MLIKEIIEIIDEATLIIEVMLISDIMVIIAEGLM
jgi:hypothetical protein